MMPPASVPYVLEYELLNEVYSAKSPESASHMTAPTREPGVIHFQLRCSLFGAR